MEKSKYKYIDDLEAMKSLDITIVCLKTGLWEEHHGKIVHLEHSSEVKPKTKFFDTNTCRCHNCKVGGDPISVATHYKKGNFAEGVKWLSEEFRIQKIPNPEYQPRAQEEDKWKREVSGFKKTKPLIPTIDIQRTEYKVKYQIFDPSKKREADIAKGKECYSSLSYANKMMLIFTDIYMFSMNQKRDLLNTYLEGRMIDAKHSQISKLGFIPVSKVGDLVKELTQNYPCDDLIELGVINDAEHNVPLSFKLWYVKKGGLIVYPSFHIYQTNLVTGFMFRPTQPEKWMIESNMKEIQMSNNDIFQTLPNGCTYDFINNNNAIKGIVEGGPDSLCCPEKINGKDLLFIASPGTSGFKKEQIGLLKGQSLRIMLDQDEAGQCGAYGYTTFHYKETENKKYPLDDKGLQEAEIHRQYLILNKIKFHEAKHEGLVQKCLDAGVVAEVVSWDKKYGLDINDVRKSMLKGKQPFKSMEEFLTKYTKIKRFVKEIK